MFDVTAPTQQELRREELNATHPVTEQHRNRRPRAPLFWVPLASAIGIALLVALLFLASRLGDDESSTTRTTTGSTTTDAGNDGADDGSATGAGSGTLSAGSKNLIGAGAAPGSLAPLAGQTVTGTDARVQEVVSDEGFWVGTGATDRVFIQLRRTSESPFKVRAGQRVDLRGTLRKADGSFLERSGVTDGEGRDLLQRQGAYVLATSIRLS
jgi:hypothetical protein